MVTIHTRAHVGEDGILRLEIPTEFRQRDVEVELAVAPAEPESEAPAIEELGWPPGFFEQTAGSIDDETFKRWPQGDYEVREELD